MKETVLKKIVIFGAFGHLGMYFTDYCYNRMRGEYEIVQWDGI